ncbi:MAG: GNAT family N-acetyltransferase [Actinomycetales bacterium]|nr:GNAT family N-acetyltransferase [Actinomycetales bacterium]
MHFTHLRHVPTGLRAPELTLRPLTADDAAADFDAVMSSREALRVWEQSAWPADDFTVEANREDLAGLERRHGARQAFTYTVTDPAGERCLGCVYVMPPDAKMYDGAAITPLRELTWADVDAAVYFWVRTELHSEGTDRALLAALRDWFTREWDLRTVLFVTNEALTQQVALLETAGLAPAFQITERDKPSPYVAFV